ncbi:MAG: pilin [Candidatus Paceibacteria bacterium]
MSLFLFTPLPADSLTEDQKSDLIVDCAQRDPDQGGYCNNINAFLLQGIIIGKYLLGIAGSLALLAFIYGGVMMLASFGNQERFKEGRKALVAAATGLVIAFGAYLLVGLVLDALGVQGNFRIL